MDEVIYKTDLKKVNWQAMKSTLVADHFDNGRSPEQLQASFTNSYATVIANMVGEIIGTARVLSDGVCNAYVVDVWTQLKYRRHGVASKMMEILLAKLEGQHVYLFTDEAVEFYKTLGFETQSIGMGKVVGEWLQDKKDKPIAQEAYDQMAESYNLLDCFECGSCSYVCPSNIPLVQYFRLSKSIVRKRQAEQKKTADAK